MGSFKNKPCIQLDLTKKTNKKMRIQVALCALATLASLASATVITVGTVTVSSAVAGGAAFLLGAKLLALKGILIGRALKGKRSAENLGEIFLEASRKDQYDCAKLLICELNAKPVQELEEDEMIIGSAFGQMDAIDVTVPSVEFDLAALIGRMVGSPRCKTIYSRCTLTPQTIMEGIRKAAFAKKN